ncbi:MAG: glycine--tRNA ligase subunit beta, partial [Gammaproteobacteria bacterium]
MAEKKDLLIEIGTEELPPKALRELSNSFRSGMASGLAEQHLSFLDAKEYATPRRLGIKVTGLATRQPDREIERRGPPLKIAVD